MPPDKDTRSIRVMPPPSDDSQPVGAKGPGSGGRWGPVVGILAAIALVWAAPWVAPDGPGPAGTNAPTAQVAVEPVTVAPEPPVLTPEETLRAFVKSVAQGNVDAVKELMSPKLPNVLGLGVAEHPQSAPDAPLWNDGNLDDDAVADFVHGASRESETMHVSDCASFADGPEVTIAACVYAVTGPYPLRTTTVETGRLFAFVVDGKIAGVVHRTS